MGILTRKKQVQKGIEGFIDVLISAKSIQLVAKRKAIDHAIDMIASTISKCEIKYYKLNHGKVKETVNDDIYYKLNIQPNYNEKGTSFFYRVINYLLHEEEVLIVSLNNNMYIANSWNTSQTILGTKIYRNVQIVDEEDNVFLLTEKTFISSDVIHLTIKSKEIKNCLNEYFREYGKLLDVTYNQFINKNTGKWRMTHGGPQMVFKDKDGNNISYDEYINKITEGLFGPEDKVMLISDQLKLEDLNAGKEISPDKLLKLEEKAENDVCKMFSIPQDLYHGNKTDKSTSTGDFFTFAVIPIMQIIEDGLNAALIKKESFLKGEKIAFNRWNLKHLDIIEASSGIDKLFSDGFSHNEICGFLNIQKLDEKWADEHYITKNYDLAENSLKGGDQGE